jgi:nucleoside-diphosphate-sugar epimerase
MKVLVTGSAGFVGGYLVKEFLSKGYSVIGIDNYSKYGPVVRDYDNHPSYSFIQGDCKNISLMKELAFESDHIIAGAAMIGGITYFHEHAYDLLAENERIIASTFDAAIESFGKGKTKKITVISSSMVFESCDIYPSPEDAVQMMPPPKSTYGFQKLATEYFAKGALEQYGLPFTIVRPFNCIGTGEGRALSDKEILSGNVKLAMSHVLPDLAQKALKGQRPLRLLGDGNQIRHYTHGRDLAKGIRLAMESPNALNNDFNLSTSRSTSVLELAKLVWKEVNAETIFEFESDPAYEYDVQKRSPNVEKARDLLGFSAEITLEEGVHEVVEWIKEQIQLGKM